MHALAQDRLGLDALGGIADPVRELGLHQLGAPNATMPSRPSARAIDGRSVMRRK